MIRTQDGVEVRKDGLLGGGGLMEDGLICEGVQRFNIVDWRGDSVPYIRH